MLVEEGEHLQEMLQVLILILEKQVDVLVVEQVVKLIQQEVQLELMAHKILVAVAVVALTTHKLLQEQMEDREVQE